MSRTNYTYEIKCRRCGKLTEMYLAEQSMITRKEFIDFQSEKKDTAIVYQCDDCKKDTVQDVVSFELKNMR